MSDEATATAPPVSFQVGDRVVLHSLASAAHLNGMHGCVASTLSDSTGRHTVDLDLLLEDQKRLAIKPSNLCPEAPIITKRRAETQGGSLVETEGRAINFVLDTMRMVVASITAPEIRSFDDLHQLRTSNEGFLEQNRLTSMAWSLWNESEGFSGLHKDGVYGGVREMIRETMPEQNGGLEEMVKVSPYYQLSYDSVDDIEAVKGWNVRITGDFWIVGMEDEGTFLVPESNRQVVYQCVGVRDPIYPKVQHHPRPVCFHVTMIPWYGRLVYDGILIPGGYGGLVSPGPPRMASASLAKKLHETVEQAKHEGRVISRLRQLEVEGGSHQGLHDRVEKKPSAMGTKDVQSKPTSEEASLVKKIAKFPARDDAQGGVWVMRRQGYTERENPNHMGLILSDDMQMVGPFTCSALIPTSTDILQGLLSSIRRTGTRPSGIGIDDKNCCDRVEFLMKECAGTEVFYYPPPSVEESMAAMAMGEMGGPPGF